MPVPAKLVTILGLLAKEESTYGVAVSLSASSDGILLQYTDRNQGAPATIEYAFDGDLGPHVASGAMTRRVAPAGRSIRAALPFRAHGAGAAYSASIFPNLHRIIKACGFNAALTTTSGAEAWTYTPTPEGTTFSSLTADLYCRGEKWTAKGVIGTLGIEFSDKKPPIWTADIRGISAALPTDSAPANIIYPASTLSPPLASLCTIAIGDFAANAVVLGGSFSYNRGIDNPRVPINADHLGFVPSGRGPRLTLMIEQTAFVGSPYHTTAGINPFALREAATAIDVAVRFPGGNYIGYEIGMEQAQLVNVTPGNQGPVATVNLEFAGSESDPGDNDDCYILFDK